MTLRILALWTNPVTFLSSLRFQGARAAIHRNEAFPSILARITFSV